MHLFCWDRGGPPKKFVLCASLTAPEGSYFWMEHLHLRATNGGAARGTPMCVACFVLSCCTSFAAQVRPTDCKERNKEKEKQAFLSFLDNIDDSIAASFCLPIVFETTKKSGKKTKAQSRLPGIPFFNPLCLAVVLPFSLAETNIKIIIIKPTRKRKTKTLPVGQCWVNTHAEDFNFLGFVLKHQFWLRFLLLFFPEGKGCGFQCNSRLCCGCCHFGSRKKNAPASQAASNQLSLRIGREKKTQIIKCDKNSGKKKLVHSAL